MFELLKILLNCFPTWYSIYIPTSHIWEFEFFTSSQTFGMVSLFYFRHSNGISLCFFISVMTNNAEYLVICVLSLAQFLFKYFAHFLFGFFISFYRDFFGGKICIKCAILITAFNAFLLCNVVEPPPL